MIPNIGPLEIAIVLIIALVVFGPKRLPELGRSIGSGINEFREGVSNIGGNHDQDDDDDDDEVDDDPVELNPPASEEPEVTEIHADSDDPAEAVDGEVVAEHKD